MRHAITFFYPPIMLIGAITLYFLFLLLRRRLPLRDDNRIEIKTRRKVNKRNRQCVKRLSKEEMKNLIKFHYDFLPCWTYSYTSQYGSSYRQFLFVLLDFFSRVGRFDSLSIQVKNRIVICAKQVWELSKLTDSIQTKNLRHYISIFTAHIEGEACSY